MIDFDKHDISLTPEQISSLIEKEGLKGFFKLPQRKYPSSINLEYDVEEMKENLKKPKE